MYEYFFSIFFLGNSIFSGSLLNLLEKSLNNSLNFPDTSLYFLYSIILEINSSSVSSSSPSVSTFGKRLFDFKYNNVVDENGVRVIDILNKLSVIYWSAISDIFTLYISILFLSTK